jgi:hypothetical protein
LAFTPSACAVAIIPLSIASMASCQPGAGRHPGQGESEGEGNTKHAREERRQQDPYLVLFARRAIVARAEERVPLPPELVRLLHLHAAGSLLRFPSQKAHTHGFLVELAGTYSRRA